MIELPRSVPASLNAAPSFFHQTSEIRQRETVKGIKFAVAGKKFAQLLQTLDEEATVHGFDFLER